MLISEDDQMFTLTLRSAYTLDGVESVMPQQSDFSIIITAEDATEHQGQIISTTVDPPVERYFVKLTMAIENS